MSGDRKEASTEDRFMESVAHSELLGGAVREMREAVVMRESWRNALLENIAREPLPRAEPAAIPIHRERRINVRPIVALAACAVAMVVGSAGTYAIMNSSGERASTVNDVALASGTSEAVTTSTAANESQRIMRFVLVAPGAKQVSIVGDFNGWNPRATPLASSNDGTTWLVQMPLTKGRHVYAFVVDGDIIADPSAARVGDHDFGGQNSVVMVGDS